MSTLLALTGDQASYTVMRTMAVGVAPTTPTGMTLAKTSRAVVVTFTDASNNETGFTIQRATVSGTSTGAWVNVGTIKRAAPTLNANGSVNDSGLGTGGLVTFADTTVAKGTTYSYRVVANDVIGLTQVFPAPAVGYPTTSADSAPTAASSITM